VAKRGNALEPGRAEGAKDIVKLEPIVAQPACEEQRVARPLRVLVTLIKEDLDQGRQAAARAGMPYYRAAGEKLIEARSQMKHGEFTPWVKRNFSIGKTQASYYMRLAEHIAAQKFSPENISSMKKFRREVLGETHGAAWHEHVRQVLGRVDTETLNLKREELKRDEERKEQRKLALRIIDTGYKALAREHHPDKGGSPEAMARLNAARDLARDLLKGYMGMGPR
jgi:hypothetical protein